MREGERGHWPGHPRQGSIQTEITVC